jgi:hypothetical protein
VGQSLPCVVEIRVYIVTKGLGGMNWVIRYMPNGLQALFKEWLAVCETGPVQKEGKE